jgi:iron complex outermembrane receptor protein
VKRVTLLSLACALDVVAPAAAQDPAPLLPEVTVSATRVEHESFDLPVSIDSIEQRTIREDNPQVNLSETLNRVPGVVVTARITHRTCRFRPAASAAAPVSVCAGCA